MQLLKIFCCMLLIAIIFVLLLPWMSYGFWEYDAWVHRIVVWGH